MTVVDARYNFIIIDVGSRGRQSDRSVFSKSIFGQKLKQKRLGIPKPSPLPGCRTTHHLCLLLTKLSRYWKI